MGGWGVGGGGEDKDTEIKRESYRAGRIIYIIHTTKYQSDVLIDYKSAQ